MFVLVDSSVQCSSKRETDSAELRLTPMVNRFLVLKCSMADRWKIYSLSIYARFSGEKRGETDVFAG